MKLKTLYLLLGFLGAGVSRLGSQIGALPVEQVIANAPPLQMEIHSLLLDRTGFLWIGCQDGLMRYDGYHVVPCRLDENGATAPGDASVRSICEGPDGRLWLATAQGLVRFDPARRTAVRFRHDEHRPDTISADDVTCLHMSPAFPGQLWIASAGGGLDRLDLASGKITRCPVAMAGSPRPGRIHVISGGPGGYLWIGASNGLFRSLTLEGRLQFCPPVGVISAARKTFAVTAIFFNGNSPGILWVGSEDDGFFRYLPATGLWQRAASEGAAGNLPADIAIRAIASFPGQPQNLLVGTENGLYHFDPRLRRFSDLAMILNTTDVQPSQCTRVIYPDRLGIFWIASCRNGLDKWIPQGKKFTRFDPYPGSLPNPLANWVTSMQELASDDILLTTYGGGALIFNRRSGAFRRLWLDPVQPERRLNSLITGSAIDGEGAFWFSSADGLAHCSADGRLRHLYRFSADEADHPELLVFTYHRDRNGRNWIGTDQGLLLIDTETNELRRFRHDRRNQKSLSHDRVNAILAEGDDTWIGTDDGLNLQRQGSGAFSVFKNDPADAGSLSSNRITYIAKDSLARIWICTANGLNLLSREGGRVHFRRFLAPGNDARFNSFLSVIEENNRYFWLGSKAGLARFDSERGSFTFYDRKDGVVAAGMDEAFFFFRSRDNEFFFGGRNGFTAFRPTDFTLNLHPPPLVLTDLRIEQDLESTTSLRAAGKKNVRVEFAALDFVRPEKNQYAYFLEGRDRDWTYQGTDRVVLLAGLPIGNYTLRVRAANNDGVWNEEAFSLPIRVQLPFYERYALAILAAVLLALLAGVVLWLRRRSRKLRAASIPNDLDQILEKFAISKREAEIVRLLLAGKSNKEIEDALFIAMATVKIHVHNIFQKVKVGSRMQLLLRIQEEARKLKSG